MSTWTVHRSYGQGLDRSSLLGGCIGLTVVSGPVFVLAIVLTWAVSGALLWLTGTVTRCWTVTLRGLVACS